MGSVVAAYKGNVPLIITAGQQTREMVLCEPYLSNPDETVFPQPWVKWAYEPKRAEDVPAAFMRAYTIALQPLRARCICLSHLMTGRNLRWGLR